MLQAVGWESNKQMTAAGASQVLQSAGLVGQNMRDNLVRIRNYSKKKFHVLLGFCIRYMGVSICVFRDGDSSCFNEAIYSSIPHQINDIL